MRRKYLFAGLAGLTLTALTAQLAAQPISHQVTLQATVNSVCTLSGSASFTGNFTSASATASTFQVPVTGANAATATGTVTIGTVMCTGGQIPLSMSRTTYIQNNSTPPSEIKYSAYFVHDGFTENGGGSGTSLNTITKSATATLNVNKTTAAIGINIVTQPTNNLAVGTYSGTLTLNINPT